MFDMLFLVGLFTATLRSATPVLLCASGELVGQRAGVINLGQEGIMLSGALVAVITAYLLGNPYIAIATAGFTGLLIGLMYGLLTVLLRANQLATGLSLTILLTGITAFVGADFVGKKIPSLPREFVSFEIWGAKVELDILIVLASALITIIAGVLRFTQAGLLLTAVGHSEAVANSVGINTVRVKLIATSIGGLLAAIGGAYLSLVFAQGWVEKMTAGRGLIAVALVLFASWVPWRLWFGSILFGGAVALQLRLQAIGVQISPHILSMFPYLVVLVVLVSSRSLNTSSASEPQSLGK